MRVHTHLIKLTAVLTVSGTGALAHADQRLDPTGVPKYVTALVIPPAMPRTSVIAMPGNKKIDYYEIAVRQFQQHILPASMGLPPTNVWSYGSVTFPATFNYPAFTIEAKWRQPVRIKWVNDLKDPINGHYLPHLLAVDQTLHWANPPGGIDGRDGHGTDQSPYTGPVPMVTHVHGARTHEESDGYAEAWYLPNATNLPSSFATVGSFYDEFNLTSQAHNGTPPWEPGTALLQYPNDQNAATMWYHDHTLGMTRLNVYAGPAGFYVMRGGPGDMAIDTRTNKPAKLPGPAPALGDLPGTEYYEFPIAVQDRSFNADGSLFYPSNRAYFEGLNLPPTPPYLDIAYHPDVACDGMMSDVSPIWNPEFFGNTIVVNGKTWPYVDVKQRRYRLRFLNGCNGRFLILRMSNNMPFWQIGAEGGFLPAPVMLNQLLMSPAERADVILDFNNIPAGTMITLQNLGPDEPYQGGEPDADFEPADPQTTGQVMQFRVVQTNGNDKTTPPQFIGLPATTPLVSAPARKLALLEEESASVFVVPDIDDPPMLGEPMPNVVMDCDNPEAEPFGPVAAKLGTLGADGFATALGWDDDITETPMSGMTETWEYYNFTADAHPIHIHEDTFRVVNRQALVTDEEGHAVQPAQLVPGTTRPPEVWESGLKDTVISYPGEVTRVQIKFGYAGRYVWHCHIVEHEDNEMMRPFRILPALP